MVSFLRQRSVPKIAAVLLAVVSAFCAIAVFSIVVATQVTNLAENIPTYQRNLVDKVHSLAQAGAGNGVLDHLSRAVERVGAEIQTRAIEQAIRCIELKIGSPSPLVFLDGAGTFISAAGSLSA
ncbi:hypothetical protein ACC697_16400 [Rhizobium ruizarguesonis]|uniref:hypothetical protein n=1 Tax=Rhizobium ruizarguesonis TaxID=2081791 RepID=UPI001FDF925C|nr:hypothetical protein [Rhizobium ruizarguesonis]